MNQTIPNIPVLATQINDTDLFEKADGPTSGQSQRVPANLFATYVSDNLTVTQAMVDAIFAWGDNVATSPEIILGANSGALITVTDGGVSFNFSGSAFLLDGSGNFRLETDTGNIQFNKVPVIAGGATGTFTTADLKTVTVTSGIITSIV